ncbi:MAG: HD domain-containing protein, partial [Weissella confusa]|nr:HD domain-containing protein [Weissella confusa]
APTDELRQVAMFHDLGKGITKSIDETTGIAHMIGHPSVGAMIALAFYGEPNNITETVLWHMEAHKGICAKVIKREKLDRSVMKLLQRFAVIDTESRVDGTA